MFKKMLFVVLVCTCVGVAYGAVTKITSLVPVGDGVAENPGGDGMVVIPWNAGQRKGVFNLGVAGLLPNTQYSVIFASDSGGNFDAFAGFTTNSSGHGNFHTVLSDDPTVNPVVIIYRDAPPFDVDINGDGIPDFSDSDLDGNPFDTGEERLCGGNCS